MTKPDTTQPSNKLTLHWIWVGKKKLPSKYLANIISILASAANSAITYGFEVDAIIWTNDSRIITPTFAKEDCLHILDRKISIHNIKELFHDKNNDQSQKLLQYLREEMVGTFANFGAASDILRLLILNQQNNDWHFYLDTDLMPCNGSFIVSDYFWAKDQKDKVKLKRLTTKTNTEESTTEYGVRLFNSKLFNVDLSEKELNSNDIYLNKGYNTNGYWNHTTNDLLLLHAKKDRNKFITILLDSVLENYESCFSGTYIAQLLRATDEVTDDTTLRDRKRNPNSYFGGNKNPQSCRVKLTMGSSGPDLYSSKISDAERDGQKIGNFELQEEPAHKDDSAWITYISKTDPRERARNNSRNLGIYIAPLSIGNIV